MNTDTTWKSGYVEANGIKMHYTRTGSDKPPLVMAHGLTDNGLCWTPVVEALAADYELIMFDARGHGLSDAPETGYSNAAHAADYAAAIQAVGLARPALIGHSMGAATGAQLAALYPDLLACLLLEDPPWRPLAEAASPEGQRAMAEEWRANVIAQQQMSREALLAAGKRDRPTWSDAEFAPWLEAKLQVSPRALDYVSAGNDHWTSYVPRIACPTLLITGDVELGAIVSPQLAREVVALNPRVAVAHIAGAGHSVRREQFASYVAAVRDFLRQSYRS